MFAAVLLLTIVTHALLPVPGSYSDSSSSSSSSSSSGSSSNYNVGYNGGGGYYYSVSSNGANTVYPTSCNPCITNGGFNIICGSQIPACANALNIGRRQLVAELRKKFELPEACTSLDNERVEQLCPENPLLLPTTDESFNAEIAENVVTHFCCALRNDEAPMLYEMAVNFQQLCVSQGVVNWQKTVDMDKITASEWAVAKYCPNYATSQSFFNPSWATLWTVSKLGLPMKSPTIMQCGADSKQGDSSVKVHIHGFKEDLFPHIYLEHEEKIISWNVQDALTESANYNSLTGVEGHFEEIPKNEFFEHTDALVFEFKGINTERMMEAKNEVMKGGMYDLIENNCAHVALRLLAAGLGCEARMIPFFSPAAMASLLKRHEASCE